LTITKDDQIIVYYYSGGRSAQTTFVLTKLLDYNNVKKTMALGRNEVVLIIYVLERHSLTVLR